MKEIKYKAWEHLVNSLITITVFGWIITSLLETPYAKKYKIWVKRIFLPLTKKIAKNIIEEIGKEEALDYSQEIARKAISHLDLSKKTKDLIYTASDKVIKKALVKIEQE